MRRLLLTLLIAGCARPPAVQVAAAASLQDALREIAANYEKDTHEHVEFAFGGSNVLARQIRAGAPVDVFFSADEKTVDAVSDLIVIATRRALLSNQLVVVSRQSPRNVTDLLKLQRIALGDPHAVPAGVYAREYFQRVGTWDTLSPRVIPMENVRAALAAADSGNVDAAIVYRTDAVLAKRARIAFAISGPDAPAIRYPVAILRNARHPDAARRFVEYLGSPAAMAVFRRYGFVIPSREDGEESPGKNEAGPSLRSG